MKTDYESPRISHALDQCGHRRSGRQAMKSAILYAMTEKPFGAGYTQIVKTVEQRRVSIWVRVQIVAGDCATALDRAKPRTGEIVLNSIELP